MAKVCPMSGCQGEKGMCVHDKMLMGVVLVLVVVGGYVFFTKEDTSPPTLVNEESSRNTADQDVKKEAETQPAVVAAGSYEVYAPEKLAKAKDGKVLLFFRASWCPSCKALDADIRAHLKDIPKGVTILEVDYDKYTDLKQKYGVIMQHTLVQVDADGKQIVKWSASPTLASVVSNIQ